MKEYMGALMATALIGGVLRMLAPEGALQKYFRFVIGLCLICAILPPLLGGMEAGRSFSFSKLLSEKETETKNYDEIYNQSLENGAKTQAEMIIREKIYQEFSLSEETAEVQTKFLSKNGELHLEEVRILLRGNGVLTDPQGVIAYIRESWGCLATIVYE